MNLLSSLGSIVSDVAWVAGGVKDIAVGAYKGGKYLTKGFTNGTLLNDAANASKSALGKGAKAVGRGAKEAGSWAWDQLNSKKLKDQESHEKYSLASSLGSAVNSIRGVEKLPGFNEQQARRIHDNIEEMAKDIHDIKEAVIDNQDTSIKRNQKSPASSIGSSVNYTQTNKTNSGGSGLPGLGSALLSGLGGVLAGLGSKILGGNLIGMIPKIMPKLKTFIEKSARSRISKFKLSIGIICYIIADVLEWSWNDPTIGPIVQAFVRGDEPEPSKAFIVMNSLFSRDKTSSTSAIGDVLEIIENMFILTPLGGIIYGIICIWNISSAIIDGRERVEKAGADASMTNLISVIATANGVLFSVIEPIWNTIKAGANLVEKVIASFNGEDAQAFANPECMNAGEAVSIIFDHFIERQTKHHLLSDSSRIGKQIDKSVDSIYSHLKVDDSVFGSSIINGAIDLQSSIAKGAAKGLVDAGLTVNTYIQDALGNGFTQENAAKAVNLFANAAATKFPEDTKRVVGTWCSFFTGSDGLKTAAYLLFLDGSTLSKVTDTFYGRLDAFGTFMFGFGKTAEEGIAQAFEDGKNKAKLGYFTVPSLGQLLAIKRKKFQQKIKIPAFNHIELNDKGQDQLRRELESEVDKISEKLKVYDEYLDESDKKLLIDGVMNEDVTLPDQVANSVSSNVSMVTPVETSNTGFTLNNTVPSSNKEEAKLSDNQQQMKQFVIEKAKSSGIDPFIFATICASESGFSPSAGAGGSSAMGLFQFTKGTWDDTTKKYGSKHGITPSTPRTNPEANATMATYLFKDHYTNIKKVKSSVSYTDIYLSHFLGHGGSRKFLKALQSNPNEPCYVGFKSEAQANPYYFRSNWTKQDTYNALTQKIADKAKEFGIPGGSFNTLDIQGNTPQVENVTPISTNESVSSSIPSATEGRLPSSYAPQVATNTVYDTVSNNSSQSYSTNITNNFGMSLSNEFNTRGQSEEESETSNTGDSTSLGKAEAISMLQGLGVSVRQVQSGGGGWTSVSRVRPELLSGFALAARDFKAATGITPEITSAFRSSADQAGLRARGVSGVARGTSPHQKGVALDIGGAKDRPGDKLGRAFDPFLNKYGLWRPLKHKLNEQQHVELKSYRSGGMTPEAAGTDYSKDGGSSNTLPNNANITQVQNQLQQSTTNSNLPATTTIAQDTVQNVSNSINESTTISNVNIPKTVMNTVQQTQTSSTVTNNSSTTNINTSNKSFESLLELVTSPVMNNSYKISHIDI